MKNPFLSVFAFLPLLAFSANDFFSDANVFFKTYVDGKGRVDYASIKAAPLGLNYVVSNVALFSLTGKDSLTQKAFWINCYNILMIKSIVDHYPVERPTDVKDIFKDEIYNAAGKRVSLDMIENKILRIQFPDARLHFALVCGAVSCPRLANFSFSPRELNQQLDERTVLAMNDPGFIRTDPGRKQILISEIFKWYKEDFENDSRNVIDFINRYRTEAIPRKYSVGYYPYDWKINGKKSGTGDSGHRIFYERNAPLIPKPEEPENIQVAKGKRISVERVAN